MFLEHVFKRNKQSDSGSRRRQWYTNRNTLTFTLWISYHAKGNIISSNIGAIYTILTQFYWVNRNDDTDGVDMSQTIQEETGHIESDVSVTRNLGDARTPYPIKQGATFYCWRTWKNSWKHTWFFFPTVRVNLLYVKAMKFHYRETIPSPPSHYILAIQILSLKGRIYYWCLD